ncbi:MAG: sigma factor [Pyrinomonadaceae bacterium]
MLQSAIAKSPDELISDVRRTKILENRLSVEKNDQMILQRIACFERKAVGECLEKYGNLIWALAKTYADTTEEAEETVEKIFLDIWKNAGFFDSAKINEKTFILLIARRHLQKCNSTVN